mmetsp:Transcript_809/g.1532  ORF Transcript_809/g.1532 Transcript_809/m.1532 type:complete len:271 (-) Transcript_809:51-863(-)
MKPSVILRSELLMIGLSNLEACQALVVELLLGLLEQQLLLELPLPIRQPTKSFPTFSIRPWLACPSQNLQPPWREQPWLEVWLDQWSVAGCWVAKRVVLDCWGLPDLWWAAWWPVKWLVPLSRHCITSLLSEFNTRKPVGERWNEVTPCPIHQPRVNGMTYWKRPWGLSRVSRVPQWKATMATTTTRISMETTIVVLVMLAVMLVDHNNKAIILMEMEMVVLDSPEICGRLRLLVSSTWHKPKPMLVVKRIQIQTQIQIMATGSSPLYSR